MLNGSDVEINMRSPGQKIDGHKGFCMNTMNDVDWRGRGWYKVTHQKGVRLVTPHPTAFFAAEHLPQVVADGTFSYHYLKKRPGAYEDIKYWPGTAIITKGAHLCDAPLLS